MSKQEETTKPDEKKPHLITLRDRAPVETKYLEGKYRRFSHHTFHFISPCRVIFGDTTLSRIAALTPGAFYIVDVGNELAQAIRYRDLETCSYQSHLRHRFLVIGEKVFNVLIKSRDGTETLFYFDRQSEAVGRKDVEKDPERVGYHFVSVLVDIMKQLKEDTGIDGFSEQEFNPADTFFKETKHRHLRLMESAEDDERDREAQTLHSRLDSIIEETNELKAEEAKLRPLVEKCQAELKAVGGDNVDELLKRHNECDDLKSNVNAKTKKIFELNMRISSMTADIERLEEQLREEISHHDDLVKKGSFRKQAATDESQKSIMNLRQHAQKREMSQLQDKIKNLEERLKETPSYTGHDVYATNAIELEKAVAAATNRWMDAVDLVNKTAKFLDYLSGEIVRHSRVVNELYESKKGLMKEFTQGGSAEVDDDDDDDILGSSTLNAAKIDTDLL